MKTIEEAAEEYAEKENIVVTEDDFTYGIALGFDFGFEKGVTFAQEWISIKDNFPKWEGIDMWLIGKCTSFTGEDEYSIWNIDSFEEYESFLEAFTHWRPIEYKHQGIIDNLAHTNK